MKKLLSILCLTALMVAVICLMTIGVSATDAPATTTEATTFAETTAALGTTVTPETTAAVTEAIATEPETEYIPPVTYPPVENVAVTTATTTAETMSDAALAKWIADKYNVTLEEAYKAADDMIGLADATLGADNVLTKLIITLKNNPVLLVVVFVSVSMILGGAVLYIKSQFKQTQTENMIMTKYVEPSKNSFDSTAESMAKMQAQLNSYDNTINEAKRLAGQSAEQTAQIKALTEQNLAAEKQRTEAYTSEMKSSVLFAATISKLLQVVDIPAGRKDAIMNCFVSGLNAIETLTTDPTILAALAEVKKESK